MLVNLRCEKFSEHIGKERTISFRKGLNVVCGDAVGSNAIGKSTLLLILDYVFGGDSYTNLAKDIMENIGAHTFYFEFNFNGEPYYYSRSTDNKKQVAICDSNYDVINQISVAEYQNELMSKYNISRPLLRFTEISDHFYRIYIRGNTLERTPMLSKINENHAKAVDVLLQLLDAYEETAAVKNAEEQLGITSRQDVSKRIDKNLTTIKENKEAIEELRGRLDSLVASNPEAQIRMLEGIDEKERIRMLNASKTMREITRALDKTRAQMDAIEANLALASEEYQEELDTLQIFFPNCNMNLFSDIERFHQRISQMLKARIQDEMKRLSVNAKYYEKELSRAKKTLRDNDLAKKYSEQVLRQCIAISRKIDEYERENKTLQEDVDKYEAIMAAQKELEILYMAQTKRMKSVASEINHVMRNANEFITDGTELSPSLDIEENKDMKFYTPNNTSEGTSFKNLVVYDLAMLRLAPIPILIHDSNILRNIDNVQFPRVLDAYINSGKQVFVAFDRVESAPEETQKIILDHRIVKLADGQELFGRSWSKTKKKSIKK